MNELFKLFLYTILYIFIDDSILPIYNYLTNNINEVQNKISTIDYVIIDKFAMIILPIYYIIYLLTRKKMNYYVSSLLIIYYKYIYINIIQYNKCDHIIFEYRRGLFWLFSTYLILQYYSIINNTTFYNTNSHYHIISLLLYFITINYKKTIYFIPIALLIYITHSLFLYKLIKISYYSYSEFILSIWILFIIVHILEIMNIFNFEIIQLFYSICEFVTKFSFATVIIDYENRITVIKNNIDLQSINLITRLLNKINRFENENTMTNKSIILINYTKKY